MSAGNENVVICRLSAEGRANVARDVARTGRRASAVVREIVDKHYARERRRQARAEAEG